MMRMRFSFQKVAVELPSFLILKQSFLGSKSFLCEVSRASKLCPTQGSFAALIAVSCSSLSMKHASSFTSVGCGGMMSASAVLAIDCNSKKIEVGRICRRNTNLVRICRVHLFGCAFYWKSVEHFLQFIVEAQLARTSKKTSQ